MRKQLTALTMLMVCAGALTVTCVDANAEPAKRTRSTTSRPISNPKFDPAADRVALFDGMEAGQLETKVIANGAEHGTLLITNTTDEPLTVEMPSSFVTVHVLKQFGQGGGGFGQGGGGGFGQGGGGQQGGGQQAQGGGHKSRRYAWRFRHGPPHLRGCLPVAPHRPILAASRARCASH